MSRVSVTETGKNYGRHLFEYRFDGVEWGLEIIAANPAEAQERLKALAWARYRGVITAKVPVSGAGLIWRIRNALHSAYAKLTHAKGVQHCFDVSAVYCARDEGTRA